VEWNHHPFSNVVRGSHGVKAKPFGCFAALTPRYPRTQITKGVMNKESWFAFLLYPSTLEILESFSDDVAALPLTRARH